LNLALVSSDKTVRETTKRPHTLEAYLKVVHKATQLGLKIVSYQILGLPNESLASMIQTLAFNARLPVLLGASPFYQTPDAPIARGIDFTEDDYLRSRLTAMAVETEDFDRDDIYTLFITTRIVNFLKGLPLSFSVDLANLLSRSWDDKRRHIGFELLKRMEETERLYFWTKNGPIENEKFKIEVFLRVLSEAGEITCRNGNGILIGDFARSVSWRDRLPSVQPTTVG
jgi:radical SAM superfamily enzyme YgiQ (UPF0313 family)